MRAVWRQTGRKKASRVDGIQYPPPLLSSPPPASVQCHRLKLDEDACEDAEQNFLSITLS